MKTLLFLFVMLISTLTHAANSPSDPLDSRLQRSFTKSFPDAQIVGWEQQKQLVRISFINHEERLFAYYNSDGEQVALSRIISTKQLPMLAATTLKLKLNNKWLTDLFEMTTSSDTSYYATIMDRDFMTIYRSDVAGNWEMFKRTKRE